LRDPLHLLAHLIEDIIVVFLLLNKLLLALEPDPVGRSISGIRREKRSRGLPFGPDLCQIGEVLIDFAPDLHGAGLWKPSKPAALSRVRFSLVPEPLFFVLRFRRQATGLVFLICAL
jgi:hypothetical protein